MTQSSGPFVSLIMIVKNGMPYLKDAIQSIANQTYRHFELVIQDGVSTDGSIDFLKNIHDTHNIPSVALESQSDNGPAQAFNRAVQRCQGDIIGSIFADDLLEPEVLETAVTVLSNQPEVAAIYGGCKMLDAEGQVTSTFLPDEFDLLRLLACELVPPFSASFFSRAVCGDRFYFDEALITELGFWLRLSDFPIVMIPKVFSQVRVSAKSNTCDPEIYEQSCQDKITAVEQYLAQHQQTALIREIYRHAAAGIYAWAAESMLWIPSGSLDWFNHYYEKAFALAPASERLKKLKLQQEFNQVQNELFLLRDTNNETQYQLDRTLEQLKLLQDELQDSQNALKQTQTQSQLEKAYLQETINAMESSKFWQIRNRWMHLRTMIGLKEND